MENRLRLQTMLENVLGSRNVYFQPPESKKLNYPAIVYSLSNMDNTFANDGVYLSKRGYSVTVIDEDPDSPLFGIVGSLSTCRFNRQFKSDNLNHVVFTIQH